MRTANIYLPVKTEIQSVKELTKDVRLFSLSLPDGFTYRPGQFVIVSVWGAGEVPISITSTPGARRGLEICVRSVGLVTTAINSLKAGESIWVRGPYGRPFPVHTDRDILFIGGGIGIVPLRPLINEILMSTEAHNTVSIIYGSRNPLEVMLADEIGDWMERGAHVIMTVDACNTDSWKGCTGLVTEHLGRAHMDFKNGTAYICGPHVMIQAAMRDLSLMGMPDDRIITTLEAHMKCGMGKCGHCFCGGKLICEEGPVFTYEEIKKYGITPGVDNLD